MVSREEATHPVRVRQLALAVAAPLGPSRLGFASIDFGADAAIEAGRCEVWLAPVLKVFVLASRQVDADEWEFATTAYHMM